MLLTCQDHTYFKARRATCIHINVNKYYILNLLLFYTNKSYFRMCEIVMRIERLAEPWKYNATSLWCNNFEVWTVIVPKYTATVYFSFLFLSITVTLFKDSELNISYNKNAVNVLHAVMCLASWVCPIKDSSNPNCLLFMTSKRKN